jgi:hypothetical protein
MDMGPTCEPPIFFTFSLSLSKEIRPASSLLLRHQLGVSTRVRRGPADGGAPRH